ncbi:CGNR zinc finger domain-containing protein [Streptomyces sp. RPT161]|uniref:CGNR zinc finger domain-containing protein n=1 Tax=Streptomyces sp. RPT161 TaxID=3015993 RepID=UPI003FCC3871
MAKHPPGARRGRARDALYGACRDEHLDVPGRPARQGDGGEAGEAEDVQTLAARGFTEGTQPSSRAARARGRCRRFTATSQSSRAVRPRCAAAQPSRWSRALSECGNVYADFSRAGRQRYCSQICVNRDSVRRHHARRAI